MKTLLLKKLQWPLAALAFLAVLAIGSTAAYFTNLADSPENIFVSGNLAIEVTQDSALSVQNWKPGDEHWLEFTLTNTGSLPVDVKGNVRGEWSEPELDPSMFEITNLERLIGADWVAVTQEGLDIGEEFFLSNDGTDGSLEALQPNEIVQYRLLTRLKPETPDEYQNKSFMSMLHMAAKQVEPGATWPDTY